MSESSGEHLPKYLSQADFQRMEQGLVRHPGDLSNRLDRARDEMDSPESVDDFVNTFKFWLATELNAIRHQFRGGRSLACTKLWVAVKKQLQLTTRHVLQVQISRQPARSDLIDRWSDAQRALELLIDEFRADLKDIEDAADQKLSEMSSRLTLLSVRKSSDTILGTYPSEPWTKFEELSLWSDDEEM